ETTALGAAYLAGLSCGVWRSTDELGSHWQAERRFHPTMARDRAESLLTDWGRAVDQCAPA
ncbi:MAG TPA: glycerol kinase, partial [Burkholderiaceae bacterium]|nr:glycerol kinase [Burkholderiaceae bacterium]